MKKITSILILWMFCIAFCANAQQKKSSGPIITFEQLEHDFGTIKQNSNGNFEFKFKNTGNEPLVLSDVIPSCGCTTIKWTKEPIMPGKTGVIKINYDTNRTGSFNKTITVLSNATEDRITLTIKGNIPS